MVEGERVAGSRDGGDGSCQREPLRRSQPSWRLSYRVPAEPATVPSRRGRPAAGPGQHVSRSAPESTAYDAKSAAAVDVEAALAPIIPAINCRPPLFAFTKSGDHRRRDRVSPSRHAMTRTESSLRWPFWPAAPFHASIIAGVMSSMRSGPTAARGAPRRSSGGRATSTACSHVRRPRSAGTPPPHRRTSRPSAPFPGASRGAPDRARRAATPPPALGHVARGRASALGPRRPDLALDLAAVGQAVLRVPDRSHALGRGGLTKAEQGACPRIRRSRDISGHISKRPDS